MPSISRFSCDCADPSDAAPTHFLGHGGGGAGSLLRLVLLETPLLIIGKPPRQYCKPSHPSTVVGYFGRRGSLPPDNAAAFKDCEAVLRACDESEETRPHIVAA